jgi:hypothetical protein
MKVIGEWNSKSADSEAFSLSKYNNDNKLVRGQSSKGYLKKHKYHRS